MKKDKKIRKSFKFLKISNLFFIINLELLKLKSFTFFSFFYNNLNQKIKNQNGLKKSINLGLTHDHCLSYFRCIPFGSIG